ncbi:MAG: OmpH family outer membrane protein [Planctomycetota bacterium]
MRTVRHQVFGMAIGLAAVLAPWASTVSAQESAPHRIAVVDVAYIFRNHAGIKDQMSKVEANLKAYDAELKQKREELKNLAARLKDLKPGTPDYAQLEERFAEMDSKLRLDMNRKRKELADAEAKVYYDNYQHIAAGVKFLANHYKINLVLRYNSEEMKQAEGQSVLRGVMKSIVYHDSELDMTPGVMQYLDQKLTASNGQPARR